MDSFFLHCKPPRSTAQEKGVRVIKGRPHFFDKKSVADAKKLFRQLLRPYVPRQPYAGPIFLKTVWYYPTPTKKMHRTWKITKPDNSNIIKAFEDVMTELGFWKDDAQVAFSVQLKQWVCPKCDDQVPGINVSIEEMKTDASSFR